MTPNFCLIKKLSRSCSFLRSEWVKGIYTDVQNDGYLTQIEKKQQKPDFLEVIWKESLLPIASLEI